MVLKSTILIRALLRELTRLLRGRDAGQLDVLLLDALRQKVNKNASAVAAGAKAENHVRFDELKRLCCR